ncbi:MAG: Mfa1 family fimbria major subunit [Muribaculaceae bacterium]|nr:Mfa1 family fimbria major subunit [Muribaculaceae bacterium]
MKIFKYGLPFAALALLASCSNDNLGEPVNTPVDDTEGVNAMFTISLPAVSDTRAIGENEFDAGTNDERTIRNAAIYIYDATSAASEDDYVLIASSQIYYLPSDGTASGSDISDNKIIQVKLTGLDKTATDGTYYALCIVNIDDTNSNGFVTPDASTLDDKKFGTWRKTVMGTKGGSNPMISTYGGKDYFTMTNAPYFTAVNNNTPGLDGIKTLVPVYASRFVVSPNVPSESAATFSVQRGVAKVTLKGSEDVQLSSIPVKDRTDKFEAKEWILDVTNYQSFPVQNVTAVSDEMQAAYGAQDSGSQGVEYFYTSKGGNIKFNHIWWAKDPNYDSTDARDFNLVDDNSTYNSVTSKLTDYCLENTMPFSQMYQNETTRIIVKGVYKVGNASTENYSFVVNPNTDEAIIVNSALLISGLTESKTEIALNTIFDSTKVGTSAEIERIANALHMNPAGTDKVDFYYKGETYYVARINHFNPSTEAKLNEGQSIKVVSDYNASQTGRFGVLRNNAYNINVIQVMGYGSPTVPPPGTTPDDEPGSDKYNIKVDINVLKWAIRDYGYTLE